MVAGAPTVSKAKMDPKMVEQIGYIDGSGIQLKQPESLQHWLEVSNATDTAPSRRHHRLENQVNVGKKIETGSCPTNRRTFG